MSQDMWLAIRRRDVLGYTNRQLIAVVHKLALIIGGKGTQVVSAPFALLFVSLLPLIANPAGKEAVITPPSTSPRAPISNHNHGTTESQRV